MPLLPSDALPIQELKATILTDEPSQAKLVKGQSTLSGSSSYGEGTGSSSAYEMVQMQEASRLREERRQRFEAAR